MQKKTINNIHKDHYRKALSIQFSLDGFSFCISNVQTKEIQHLTVYSFDTNCATPEALLQEIEILFTENTRLLHQDFEQVLLIHQNNLSTLVPGPLFDENSLTDYLDYNIKTLANDFLAFDHLTQADIKNVYIPYVNINNFFFQKFGEFVYKHHSTVLIDKLILHSKNDTKQQFFVHVNHANFDIVVIENAKLIFYNSFSFNTKEDFIYYILFTAEQLQLNPETFLLSFLGDIEKESELYLITYQYIRHVSFLSATHEFFTNEQDFSSHSNYITTP